MPRTRPLLGSEPTQQARQEVPLSQAAIFTANMQRGPKRQLPTRVPNLLLRVQIRSETHEHGAQCLSSATTQPSRRGRGPRTGSPTVGRAHRTPESRPGLSWAVVWEPQAPRGRQGSYVWRCLMRSEHQTTLWTRPKQVRLSAQQSDSGKPWGRHTHCPRARHLGPRGEGRAALCPRDVTQWVWTLFKLTPRTDTAGLFPSALKASV